MLQDIFEKVKQKLENLKIDANKIKDFQKEYKNLIGKRALPILDKKYSNQKPLFNYECKKELKKIQENFIITNVDKCANNFAFVCKKLYIEIINKVMGITNRSNDWTIDGNITY